jgi:PAS domain S-box-containing protein
VNPARFWRSIAAKIFSALVCVCFACIVGTIASLYLQSGRALRSVIEDRNLQVATQASREISRYVTDSIAELDSLSSVIEPLPHDPWIQHAVLANLSIEFPRYRWMAILGPEGMVLADSRLPGGAGAPIEPAVVQRVLAGRTIASPVKIGDDFIPSMIICASTRSPRGSQGWLVAELQLRSIWGLMDAISVGKTGIAYLVSDSGVLIAHPDKVRVLAPGSGAAVPPPPAGLGDKGSVRVDSPGNTERYLTAYAKVAALDWVVAVQQPLRDAYLPASALLRQAVLLLLIGLALSLALGYLLSRALSAPLVELLEGTRTIAAGQPGFRIRIRGGDEVRGLADSFNAMVESLQARTEEVAESARQYQLLTERVNDIIFSLDGFGRFTFISPRLEAVTGYAAQRYIGAELLGLLPRPEQDRWRTMLTELSAGSGRQDREAQLELTGSDGRAIALEVHITADGGPGGSRQIYGIARDVSERARLLEQLGQSQKMEAVGRLAGGVAHDFNNLLTAIIGYCDYSLLSFDDLETLRKNLEEIKKAGLRAASLTQQLLAFSRRQVMKPRILDINGLIANLTKLLMRLIGEDIALDTRCAPGLWCILADPGQIEQVIMNLCINARDALPRGGTISVETSNVALESPRTEKRFTVAKGEYVRLRISDNGIGMDRETRSHLFEPFFTTKEVGKGTGLGLSTVYGIVKQTGGYIWVESEPGKGAAFDIYFPRSEPTASAPSVDGSEEPPEVRGGTETVLLVEDEAMIRAVVRNILGSHGYTVLEAGNGELAEEIARTRRGDIDLIVTDVVLPGMSGRELVERLSAARPGVPALFMSGYTQEIVDQHGVLRSGLSFLQKPFTPKDLLMKVRELLDGHAAP